MVELDRLRTMTLQQLEAESQKLDSVDRTKLTHGELHAIIAKGTILALLASRKRNKKASLLSTQAAILRTLDHHLAT